MKKKILIGAIALMSIFGGITIFESISGQNEAKANDNPYPCCGFHYKGLADNNPRDCLDKGSDCQ